MELSVMVVPLVALVADGVIVTVTPVLVKNPAQPLRPTQPTLASSAAAARNPYRNRYLVEEHARNESGLVTLDEAASSSDYKDLQFEKRAF